MSAFIVEPDCINCIVTFIHKQAGFFCRWLKLEHGYDLTNIEDVKRFANALYTLNCEAVDERYGKGTAAKDEAERPPFSFRFVHRDGVAVYKAVCCLGYQCAEGDIPNRPLYQALEPIAGRIASAIVKQLPAYDAAPWGD